MSFFPNLSVWKNYSVAKLGSDARAGMALLSLGVPMSLTYALITGVPPLWALMAMSLGCLASALFAPSRFLLISPTHTAGLFLAGTIASMGLPAESRTMVIPFLVFVSGLTVTLASFVKLSAISKYISRSVVVGLLCAVALLLGLKHSPQLLGVVPSYGPHPLEGWMDLSGHSWQATPLLMGAATLLILITLQRFRVAWPAPALAIGVAGVLFWLMGQKESVPVTGFAIETVWTVFAWRDLTADILIQLILPCLALSLLLLVETNEYGKTLSPRAGERFQPSQQLLAVGVGNLAASLLPALPLSVSRVRSRHLFERRPASPVAALIGGLGMLAFLPVINPLAAWIPLASIAGLLLFLLARLVDFDSIRLIFLTSADEIAIFLATFLSALFLPLPIALFLGMGLSIVLFLKQVGSPELVEQTITAEGDLAEKRPDQERSIPDICIVHVEGDLFFGASDIFLDQARHILEDTNIRVVILRMKNAHHLDATCAMAIDEFLLFARKQERFVVVSGAHRQIYRVFRSSGLLDRLGRDNFFMDIPSNPTLSTRNALRRARELLGEQKANIRIFTGPNRDSGPTEPR